MLSLKNIVKEYKTGDSTVLALRGISIDFRKSEFVSILGPSGCGKTTMLNIVGGLDRYTEGDLIINGKSTKEFTDSDWDTYRNHSVGFVFQSYNLIPHQNVLSNVELALTLSGVSKSERRQRAIEVLKKVGLEDQIYKKPNQLSGGQMQRVAIARALVNDPEILLADEPTGALDSETSVQIMDILKEIAKDRLVVMVTHNPDLAEKYSTRIVRLLDGKIIDDSNPYHESTEDDPVNHEPNRSKVSKSGKTSMSFMTALSLSLNNLMTKKTRTFLTAFAGSIGIIGIALILSLSNGVNSYINKIQQDTLSSYPLTITEQSVDQATLMASMMEAHTSEAEHDLDKVYSNDVMTNMIDILTSEVTTNNMKAFKEFLESEESKTTGIASLSNAIQYGYNININIYKADTSKGIVQVNPSTLFEDLGMGATATTPGMSTTTSMGMNVWQEMLGNQDLLNSQYDVLAGTWPKAFNEVVLIVNKNNEISDYALYTLGLKDSTEIEEQLKALMMGKTLDQNNSDVNSASKDNISEPDSYTYDELLNLTFKLVLETDKYENINGVWVDKSKDPIYMKNVIDKAPEIKVVGIVRATEDTVTTSMTGAVGYTSALTEYVINQVNNSDIVKQQLANPEIDVFTGRPFGEKSGLNDMNQMGSLSAEEQAYLSSLSEDELAALMANYSSSAKNTLEDNLFKLGVVDLDKPSIINIYPKSFEEKEKIIDLIEKYNEEKTAAGQDEDVINYTDIVGVLMSSVTTIVNVVSYVLIAFVAISLVVSSIMIGIITYISVLERTKEIGILRSIGASKKDISRVFNAETVIVGFVAGVLGILLTVLLNIPINMIIRNLANISAAASLPVLGAVILVAISMTLTVIAGLIPSRIAANKDPVVALRTE